MLTVVCWKWGSLFGPEYVNRTRSMLARHLRLPHRLLCITDDPAGIEPGIATHPITRFLDAPRCRRRMWQYSAEFGRLFGERFLSIDLDVVILDDITEIVARPEPLVCWRVGYAGVYSGSFVLFDGGELDAMWREFERDPIGFPARTGERGASDQAMLNFYLAGCAVPHWTERDGFVSWFGAGYERLEHCGMGPSSPEPPAGARVVVLGSADKSVLDEGRYQWMREHWR